MAKLRKMLGKADSPYVLSLMALIETQSKETLAHWCIDYAEKDILPIYKKQYPEDRRPEAALNAARTWLAGEVKLPEVKDVILNSAHAAAREAEGQPAAQAAARCAGQCASTIHSATHCIGLAFYGCAALAYDQLGIEATPDEYDQFAADECARMEAALAAVAVTDEPNPAKINWKC